MKKLIVVFVSFIVLILIAAVMIPVIFKDDIQKLVQKQIDENIDARVFFDPATFSLTLFEDFPNPTASFEDFGIIGKGLFEGDTLFSVSRFNISIDLFSLFGNQYTINTVDMERPRMNVIVTEGGEANYNIVIESQETASDAGEESADFNLSVDNWSISNGRLTYIDKSMDFSMLIEGLNHFGSGDISMDEYDLSTVTTVEKSFVNYEGVAYLNGQKLFADATVHINMPNFKVTFLENEIKVNDFPLSFDGFVAMPGDDIDMDISFSANNTSIKSLYSLIPGVYTEDYENIKAEGNMSFSGKVKGKYNKNSMPAYHVALTAENGMIAYPELPTPISNINIDMSVDCEDGNVDNTRIEVNKMHMDLGKNPIDATLTVRNLKDYSMLADVSAKLNLAELSTMFPMEGTELKGLFSLDLKADGIYDSVRNIMPSISATLSMENGYIKSAEFPKALENISFKSSVDGASGKQEDMTILVENFKMVMEGEELSGRMVLKNLVDYQWDLVLKGGLDLAVISEVYPIEDMHYTGHLLADIQTSGKYSDVEAERYDKFPTSGNMTLTDFSYTSPDLPQGMKIARTEVTFDPQKLNIDEYIGTVGHSDMNIKGYISNYISYVFSENELLKGKMNLNSNVLDVNEWMTDEETDMSSEADTVATEVIAIPKNVDFEFNSSIKNIYYDNLNLQNAKGLLIVRDGILDMSNLSFNLYGGSIVMNGKYDTSNPDKPAFAYNLNVKSMSIPQAFTGFTTIQTFAPMAKLMNGEFSTDFAIAGLLKKDLSPVYESLNGSGLIKIAEAYLKDSKLASGIAGFMKTDAKSAQLSLKDVIMKTSLENGRAYVAPFDVNIAGQQANLTGSIGADGSLDYKVATEVDAGAVGQQVNQLLAGLKGQDASSVSSKIKLNFNVGGTYDNPKITLAGTTNADGTTTTVKEQVKEDVIQEVEKQAEDVIKEAEETIEKEAEKVIKEAEEEFQPQIDTLKKKINENLKEGAGDILGEEADSTVKDVKKSIQDLFKKKK